MFIIDFYAKLTSNERSRLFEALRRISRLEEQVFLESGTVGWPDWPPVVPPRPCLEKV